MVCKANQFAHPTLTIKMDIKTATELIRKHLASTILVVLVLCGGIAYIWGEYKDLLKQKDILSQEMKNFNSEKSAFEKYQLTVTAATQERKLELDKREFILNQLEDENKTEVSALQQRAAEYSAAFAKLQDAERNVSAEQRIKNAEYKIQKLMSEFSSMGVNLNAALKCGDSEAESRFNAAKSKYYEILAVSESYGLYENYKQFFFHNSPSTWSACTK